MSLRTSQTISTRSSHSSAPALRHHASRTFLQFRHVQSQQLVFPEGFKLIGGRVIEKHMKRKRNHLVFPPKNLLCSAVRPLWAPDTRDTKATCGTHNTSPQKS